MELTASSPESWSRAAVLRLLSEQRMKTYLDATSGDLELAFDLYARNLQISSILLKTTAMVEVIMRNAIDSVLVGWNAANQFADDWFDLPLLDKHARNDVAQARTRILRRGCPVDHDKTVAELSFGFWRFLTTRRYHASLWVPVLHRAFPNGNPDLRQRQREVSRLLCSMTFIRNRAAHLEPMFRRNMTRDAAQAKQLLGWISEDAVLWFDDVMGADVQMQISLFS